MSDDLVKRLRDRGVCSLAHNSCRNDFVCEEAAGRIEELEANLVKALEALESIAGKVPYADDPWDIAQDALKKLKGETDGG